MSWYPPIDEGALDLYVVEKDRDPWENVSASEQCLAVLHQVRDRVLAITDTLLELGSNQSDRFCLVQTEPPGESLLCQKSCLEARLVRRRAASYSVMLYALDAAEACPAPWEKCAWFGPLVGNYPAQLLESRN